MTWYVGRVKPTRQEPIRRDCDALQAIYDAETTSEVEAQEAWGIAQPNTFQKRLSRARAGLCDAIECLEALGPEQRPEWAHQADLHLLRRYVRLLKR